MGTVLIGVIILAMILFLWMIIWGVFWFLVQAGVIARKAMEPPTLDTRDYSLSQSREIKSEDK